MSEIKWLSTDTHPLGRLDKEIKTEDSISYEVTLFAGYDDLRLFAVETKGGQYEYIVGYIDDNGMIMDTWGDDSGRSWDDVTHWADFNGVEDET